MTPQLEAIAMLNNMFESHDGRPVDMAVLHRKDYAALVEALSLSSSGTPHTEQHRSAHVAESQAPSIRDGDAGVAPGRGSAVPFSGTDKLQPTLLDLRHFAAKIADHDDRELVQHAADMLEVLWKRPAEPDAWLVVATREDVTHIAFRRKKDAEQDAYEWRINGATTEILPLYCAHPSATADNAAVVALRELVRLKDLAELIERDDDVESSVALQDDYDENKPKAWAAARAALCQYVGQIP
jgi:hypothetical protein